VTGNDIYKEFLTRIDKSYSKFVDTIKLNRIFKRALVDLCDKKYLGLSTQKEYDELRYNVNTSQKFPVRSNKVAISPLVIKSLTQNGLTISVETLNEHNVLLGDQVTFSGVQGLSTVPDINGTLTVFSVPDATHFTVLFSFISGTYTPNTGKIVHKYMIADYLHLFTVKCQFSEPLKFQVEQVITSTPAQVVWTKRNNLATGEKIIISGYPTAPINGTFYYEALTSKKGRLWLNSDLTQGVSSGVSSQVGGSVQRIYYNYAEPVYSDRKINVFEKAKVDSPKNETANGFLKFYPENRTCSEIEVDYFAIPNYFVDCNDTILDLESIYPAKFLYRLISEAVILYTSPSRDVLLAQLEQQEVHS